MPVFYITKGFPLIVVALVNLDEYQLFTRVIFKNLG